MPVASTLALRGGGGGGIAIEPVANNIVVELLAPQQAGKGLAHDVPRFVVGGRGMMLSRTRRLPRSARRKAVEVRAKMRWPR